jgi:hypothetical protein
MNPIEESSMYEMLLMIFLGIIWATIKIAYFFLKGKKTGYFWINVCIGVSVIICVILWIVFNYWVR